MAVHGSALEIHVHLEDGRVAKFVQSDPVLARKTLTLIHPGKLFSQRLITIHGDHSLTAYPCASIVRIDFVTDMALDWPFHHGAIAIDQILPTEFEERCLAAITARRKSSGPPTPGEPITLYAQQELVNGERLFLEVHTTLQVRTSVDQNVFINNLFSSGGLHARRREGGMIIVNPAKLVSMALHPGPMEYTPGSWLANPMHGL